jgi:hypothetical protein
MASAARTCGQASRQLPKPAEASAAVRASWRVAPPILCSTLFFLSRRWAGARRQAASVELRLPQDLRCVISIPEASASGRLRSLIMRDDNNNSAVMPLNLLPKLRFTDSGLICEGRANVAYESIDAITFKLLPLMRNRLSRAFYGIDASVVVGSCNVVPKFALHLAGGETVALFTGWESAMPRSRVEAICGAAEFLSERTFDRRFGRYRAEFLAEDRFSVGRHQFYRNGDIFRDGRRLCNLHDSSLSTGLGDFHIHFERQETPIEKLQSVLGQAGHTIDISRDRDCFLSMVRLAYGIFWADERYRDDPE